MDTAKINNTSMYQSKLKDMSNVEIDTEIKELSSSVISEGTDGSVKTGDNITVHYRGWLADDGTIFDESFNHGDTGFTFSVGRGVIEGWSEGVVGMKVGEIRRLKIPYDKGYGEYGAGYTIPPFSNLIFDVELISIN